MDKWKVANHESYRDSQRKYNADHKWLRTYYQIKYRCTNPSYRNYRLYGGKGIKSLITKEELKELWIRDKAHLMKRPSIDRLNPDGHYTKENCRYIELSVNSSRATSKRVMAIKQDGSKSIYDSVTKAAVALFGKNNEEGIYLHIKSGIPLFGIKFIYVLTPSQV